ENRDKIPEEDAANIEKALEKGREAMKGSDKADMEKAIEEISQASHKLAEVLYAAQSSAGEPSEEPRPEAGGDEEVVDAEYTDQ
ncbi:MAG: molecular chaperone DnaK, partial [bacterium]